MSYHFIYFQNINFIKKTVNIIKEIRKTIKKHEALRRHFFWGGSFEERKIVWIAWDKVLALLKNGGLGVGSLHASNKAILNKG